MNNSYSLSLKIGVIIFYFVVVIINTLANALPINGQTTGQISDFYANIFAPAGLTFSIWGVIYVLLFLYAIYQAGLFHKKEQPSDPKLLKTIGIYFIISSIANGAWIFAWHYNIIPLSMLLMLIILVSLILINLKTKDAKLTNKEKFFLRLPFSIYFGWITVATIANFTVLLVSMNWSGFGISETIWASIIITIGMIIGVITTIRNKDIAYGIVLVWAYIGILIKHMSITGFDGQYPLVIGVVITCITLFVLTDLYVLIKRRIKTN